MKKTIMTILLAAFAIIFSAGNGYCTDSRIVKNVDDFVKAIGSNRTILIENNFTLSTEPAQKKPNNFGNKHVQWEQVFDGWELHIKNVQGLRIMGTNGTEAPTQIVTNPRYAHVLIFENCKNITIENLRMGHTPEGECIGGVMQFTNCSNINMEQASLFGCGTEGLCLEGVKNFKATLTTIENCTNGIMTLRRVSDISFDKCSFFENAGGLYIIDCKDVNFNNCYIARNNGTTLFFVLPGDNKGPFNTNVTNTTFKNNNFQVLDSKTFITVYKNCTFGENNTFETDGFRINKDGFYDGFTIKGIE